MEQADRYKLVEQRDGTFHTWYSPGQDVDYRPALSPSKPTLRQAIQYCAGVQYMIKWYEKPKKEENMHPTDSNRYVITEGADRRFRVALHWGLIDKVANCASHDDLRGAIVHCQQRSPSIPFTVVWYEEPKKSKEDEAYEGACKGAGLSAGYWPFRVLWKAGVEFGRQNPNPT